METENRILLGISRITFIVHWSKFLDRTISHPDPNEMVAVPDWVIQDSLIVHSTQLNSTQVTVTRMAKRDAARLENGFG